MLSVYSIKIRSADEARTLERTERLDLTHATKNRRSWDNYEHPTSLLIKDDVMIRFDEAENEYTLQEWIEMTETTSEKL